MKLFHLTDMHCGNAKAPFLADELVGALADFAQDFSRDDAFLLITGDVTLGGAVGGYKEAQYIVQKGWLNLGGDRKRIILCPGNHDICSNEFDAFDKFAYAVRRGSEICFQNNSSCVLDFGDTVFASINSAHHRDHRFGSVDVDELEKTLALTSVSRFGRRIALVHHHVIGVEGADLSTIRNALPFLQVLEKYNFELLLHGHRHSLSRIEVGSNNMQIRAGRSLNFATPGYANGMTIHNYIDNMWQSEIYFLSKDNAAAGRAKFAAQGRV